MTASFTRAFLTHDLPLDVVHDVDGGLLGRGDHLLRVSAGAVLLLTSQSVSNVQTLLTHRVVHGDCSLPPLQSLPPGHMFSTGQTSPDALSKHNPHLTLTPVTPG